jgi:hypothetical protein
MVEHMTVSHAFVKALSLVGLICLATGLYLRQLLPASAAVLPEVLEEPRQTATKSVSFIAPVKGIDYTVKPMAAYEISGIVVSRHDTGAWWDWVHAAYNDHLNVVDLCIVWGANAKSDNYRHLHYSSGQWTCTVATNSNEHWAAFDENSLSNNHVLTDDPRLAKMLKGIRIGDQVRLKGYLAEYSHKSGTPFTRGTSLVRTDRGNGACETLFVQDVEVLKKTSSLPSLLRWAGGILLLLCVIAWLGFTPLIEEKE